MPNPSNPHLFRRFLPSIATQAARITAPGYWNVEQILFLGIILLGLILRLAKITHEFDPDEVFTVKIAGRSFLRMIESTLADRPHPPLYNILLWVWKRIMGPTEVATRLLSIGTFVGFMVLTRMFLRKFCSNTQTLLALFLFATSPFFVFYGQQVRCYALLAMLIALNLVALSKVYERSDTKHLAFWSLSCALLVHVQYVSVIFILLSATALLLHSKEPSRRFVIWTMLGLSSIIPWAIVAFGPAIFNGNDPVPHIFWIRPPSFSSVQFFYASVIHHGSNTVIWFVEFMVDFISNRYKIFSTIVFLFIAFLFILKIAIRRKICFYETIIFIFAFFVPALFFIISVYSPKSIFISRQLMISAFFCIVLIVYCIPKSKNIFSNIYISSCLIYGVVASKNFLSTDIHHNHREMAAFVLEHYPNTPIVTEDDWAHLQPMMFYADRPTYRLISFNDTDKELLYLCDDGRCEDVYTGIFRSRAEHLKAVVCGERPAPCNLNLFLIHPTPAVQQRQP